MPKFPSDEGDEGGVELGDDYPTSDEMELAIATSDPDEDIDWPWWDED